MGRTINEIINEVTNLYVNGVNRYNHPEATRMERELLDMINGDIKLENCLRDKGEKFKTIQTLPECSIGELVLATEHIVNVQLTMDDTEESKLLCIYHDAGPKQGIYCPDLTRIRHAIRSFHLTIKPREIETVIEYIKDRAPIVKPDRDPLIVPVNNGLYHRDIHALTPFTPERIILKKCRVDFNPSASNVVLDDYGDGMPWDLDSWISGLFKDPDKAEFLYEVFSASLRPYTRWNKAVFFYSESGNSGKGCAALLMKNLLGDGNYCSISIDEFGDRFALTKLITSSAVICDENDVMTVSGNGTKKGKAKLKAAITNDSFQIDRKNKEPITMVYDGLIVQCINSLPTKNMGDLTQSLFRRFIILEFDECYEGRERKYIKDDYLNRSEVLEYLLKRSLELEIDEFSVPEDSKVLLEEYKQEVDPVRQFVDEIFDQFVWDVVPLKFIYQLFLAYCRRSICRNPEDEWGDKAFFRHLKEVLRGSDVWTFPNKAVRFNTDKPEPLIYEYDLTLWRNESYTGNEKKRICLPSMYLGKSCKVMLRK